MVSLYLIFYACLELRFPDVETNMGHRRPVPGACRILCSNVRGLSNNLSDVTVASSQYDLLFPGLGQASYVSVSGSWIWSSCIVVPGWSAAGQWDGCICARWILSISPT